MSSLAKELGYNGTVEDIYTSKNSEIIEWTAYFHNTVRERKIFENFSTSLPRNFSTARAVSTAWHLFSEFMPWFLCYSASKVSSNLARHYVIQTAFEELGMRDHKQIHSGIFWHAAKSIGVDIPDSTILQENSGVKKTLKYLKNKLLSYSSDMKIFGILLGLEMPAIENIETLYNAMSHNETASDILNKDLFFLLHREVEVEHVRLTVSNFLRFQNSQEDKDEFVIGFMDGINFWELFWREVKDHIMLIASSSLNFKRDN